MKSNKGFSLIELIIVIAIMVILIGAGGFGLSLLFGTEARSAWKNMDAQLNDVKTGAMSRASECMYVYYIDVPDTDKDDWAQKGVDTSGFYADKRISTIDNVTTIVTPMGDGEYSRIGSAKVTFKAICTDGTEYEIKNDGSTAIEIEYDRKTGKLNDLRMGSMSGVSSSGDGTFSSSSTGTLKELTFTYGLRTYTISFDAEVGTHKME
ncbi:MAG: prepilin-type N-terminal cleavage/methylation domain-containing protein [Lachnospiraceae bacterium]|nr:prepilin-type N-terminal cleavage/methylation domain-containing protein [Lachnospiraceae bacterium]